MWNRAPRWVRRAIATVGAVFAGTFGFFVVLFLLAAISLRGCELDLFPGRPDPNPELTAAIRSCDVDGVEAELEKGGRPFIEGTAVRYDDGPDLREALRCGPAMVDLLVAYAVENDGGDSVLHAAIDVGDPEVVGRVLEGGIDVDTPDDAGDTALLDAVTTGDAAMVEVLLGRGAAVDARNESGHTPLFRAVGFDNPLLVTRLLDAGADPNVAARLTMNEIVGAHALQLERPTHAPDPDTTASTAQSPLDVLSALQPGLGFAPGELPDAIEPVPLLYVAVAMSSDEVVAALLQAGADPTIGAGPAGHLPADAADLLGRTEVAAAIRAAGG